LRSLAIGLKVNDPAMVRTFQLRIANACSDFEYFDNESRIHFGRNSRRTGRIVIPRKKHLFFAQSKILDDLCKELFGLELAQTPWFYYRIYKKPPTGSSGA